MNQSAAAVTPDNQPGDDEVGPAKFVKPKESPMRFTYKSGSTPLDGYTIKRGIGAGGFGEVYYATTDSGKEVALKHIQRNLEIEMRGAKHCLNLKHPHLVALFDIRYDSEGEGWIVMEYVHGDSLQDFIERHPNGMPREDALSWFKSIASAVNYLHDHGIVHRDLKPGNIFNDQGTVKIGDYGLSKFISVSRRSGQTESVGTFHYMAPEIGQGRYGREIDVYALGIILFEMLTGRVPFEGESSQEIIMKHLTASPDLGDLAEPYRSVVAAALEKDPEKRTSSAEEMLEQLGLKQSTTTAVSTVDTSVPTSAAKAVQSAVASKVKAKIGYVEAPAPKSSLDDEPIAMAVGSLTSKFKTWWNHNNTSLPIKVVVLTAIAFGLVANLSYLVPVALVGGAFYMAYLMVRQMVKLFQEEVPGGDGKPAKKDSSGRYHPEAMKRKYRASQDAMWHPKRKDRERAAFAIRTPRQRIQELLGSLIVSGIMAVLVSFVLLLISEGEAALTKSAIVTLGPAYVFFAGLTIVTTWSVLITAKFWEDKPGDQAARRIVMMLIGILLGVAAWIGLLILPMETLSIGAASKGWFGLGGLSTSASIGSLMMYFGLVFLVPRWWKLADPLRTNWLSIWHTGVFVAWAAILSTFWTFLQPWGIMLVGATVATIQLSAPWFSQERRDLERRRYEQELKETTSGDH
ncbi:serine/threonine-protein kinase [Bremerella cremea]|uniref:serine/threonine-protein kinase n=1 Tax=Bremerella cremea TaxID=1031537 RepID=UPI0031EBE56E